MGNLAKLELGLDLTKDLDKKAYTQLKSVSAAERKELLLSFLTGRRVPTSKVHTLLKIVSLIISSILVVLSVYFTHSFNHLVMPFLWALLLSIGLVSFTSLALTLATYTSHRTSFVFKTLWVIGIAYSIFTAFAGQYNSFRSYTSTEVSTDYSSVLSELRSQESKLISEIDELRSLQKPYADLIADLSSSPEKKVDYPQTWKDANNRFDTLQGKIDSKSTQLEAIRSQQLKYLDTSASVSNTTVYTWLSRLLHIPSMWIELFVLTLPSCFIDLAASILLKFALGKSTESRR